MIPRDDERRKFEALLDQYAEAAYNAAVIGEQYTETEQLRASSNLVAAAKLAVMEAWLARAEQAETPLNGCTVCGAAMEFKCPSCGSTPAPTEPSGQAETPSVDHNAIFGLPEIFVATGQHSRTAFFNLKSAQRYISARVHPERFKVVVYRKAETPRVASPIKTCRVCQGAITLTDGDWRHVPLAFDHVAAPVEVSPAPTPKCGNEFALKHGYFCELPKGHGGDHEAECPNPQFHQSWPQVPVAPGKE